MKYSIFLFFAITFIFNNSAFSQSDDFSKNQFKFYLNTIKDGYLENSTSNNGEVAKVISKFGTPSIAYVWKTDEKKMQEIEFSAFFERNVDISLAGNTVTSGFSEKLAYISARYERNRILLNSDKIDLSLGGGLQAAYIHNSFMPQTSSDFPLSYSGLHTKLTVVPRLLVKFNNFALDFNMPFSVMQLNLNTFQEENPALSRAEQVSGRLEYLLFPSSYFLQARLGIVFDLN